MDKNLPTENQAKKPTALEKVTVDPVIPPYTPEPATKFGKDKKKLFIVVAVALVILILVGINIFKPNNPSPTKNYSQNDVVNYPTKGMLSFTPSELSLPDNSGAQTVYVNFDAGDQKVSAVEFEIHYETGGLKNVVIEAFNDKNSAMGQSLKIVKNDFYPKRGVAYLKYQLKEGYFEQKGSAILAKITFSTKKVVEYTDIEIKNPKMSFTSAGENFTPGTKLLHITKR